MTIGYGVGSETTAFNERRHRTLHSVASLKTVLFGADGVAARDLEVVEKICR